MKAKISTIMIAMTLLLCAGQAQAVDKMELARQYFDLFKFEENIKAAFSAMATQDMVAMLKEADIDGEIDQAELMEEMKSLQQAFTQSDYLRKIKEEGIKATAEVFSKDELKALIQFYSSKEGQSIIDKMPIYMQKSQEKIGKMTIPVVKKMVQERLKKREKDKGGLTESSS